MALQLNPPPASSSAASSCKFCDRVEKLFEHKLLTRGVLQRKECGPRFRLKVSSMQPPNAVSLETEGSAVQYLTSDGKSIGSQDLKSEITVMGSSKTDVTLSIIVVGASGELARSKIFPALFALFYEDHLTKDFTIFGYGRTVMSDDDLRSSISENLGCRVGNRGSCEDKMNQFLERCFYCTGQYSSEEHFLELDEKLKEKEVGMLSNRLYYLAVPPHLFVDAVRCSKRRASSNSGWTRVIVEKPFGQDLESSRKLTRDLNQYLKEDQIFRINHHLGEELFDNLLALRFSNLVFEALWSRNYVRNVQLIFSEDISTEGQGRGYEDYGVIRDVMQNHLIHLLALFAMETPVSLDAEDIRNEKVKVLRSISPPRLEDVVIGQHKGYREGNMLCRAFTDGPTVSEGSLTPTYAAATFFINNARWDGVPFMVIAGKGLHSKRAEIRVQFRHVPGNLYGRNAGADLWNATNELVLRVQPDEAIYLRINNKVPGLGKRLDRSNLNLLFGTRYPKEVPDAYERLLLDAIKGERRLFIRNDELEASWSIFTPLLKALKARKVQPELYPFGSEGPVGVHYLAAKYNILCSDFDEH
ncbi:hypothetical protein MLD38_031734 [Melastoma candidum]|uniref:Uncharacterized protein n=1 Tax=Melastoma candidum TaxID=119954 RepID=A0ACB9MTW3_9MYRT|nr:hypothetical protein MLD38_031734 [Melastoma candidum]